MRVYRHLQLKMARWIFLLLCVQLSSSEAQTHYGTEFYVWIVPRHENSHIRIDIVSQSNGSALLDVPYLGIHRNYTLTKGSTNFSVSNSVFKTGSFLDQRGIRIRTDLSVAVYVSRTVSPFDTYVALPVSTLGVQYKVASYNPDTDPYSYLSVIGTQNNTQLLVRFINQTVKSEILQEFTVYQLADGHDLSDTFIEADKPVAAISSVPCTQIPNGVDDCDFLQEQLIPTAFWKSTYIIPPVYPKHGFLLLIQSVKNESTFCLRNKTDELCTPFSQSSPDYFIMGTEPSIVTSVDPVGVVQYGLGQEYDNIDGDPFMTLVPALDNYLSDYYFVVPRVYSSFSNYLAVIVVRSELRNILLDYSPLRALRQFSVPSPLDNYTVAITNIGIGYHTLTHYNNSVTFGAVIYGLEAKRGYGYSLGFGFISGETHLEKRTCFYCDDMSSLQYCDSVRQCGVNQVCYAEKYMSSSGTHFKSGCINKNFCDGNLTKDSNTVCVECCSGDFCNRRCGDDKLPDREKRGPFCYDCLHVDSPELCSEVTLCASNEVCSIHKYRWGDSFHFKTGCSHPVCVPIKRLVPVEGMQKSTSVCSFCCSDDFFNHKCTTTSGGSSGPQIVG